MNDVPHAPNVDRMVIGLLIVGAGVVLLWAQFADATPITRLWPLLLIALGASRLFSPGPTVAYSGPERQWLANGCGVRSARWHQRRGAWLVVIGVWLLMDQLRIASASTTWPLLLVAMGLGLVWRSLGARDGSQ